MKRETSSSTDFHVCRVERVHPSGLVDVVSNRGHRFAYVNIVFSGTEMSFKEGDMCLLLNDKAQQFIIGKVLLPREGEDGGIIHKSSREDIISLRDANTLAATDNFGNQSKIIVHPAAGIIIDGAEGLVEHFDAGKSCIRQFAERKEIVTIPHYQKIWHKDGICESRYRWRNEVDIDAFDDEMAHVPDVSRNTYTLDFMVDDEDEFVRAETKDEGDDQVDISINKGGDVSIETHTGEVHVSADGDVSVDGENISIEADSGSGEIEITNSFGTISIDSNGAVEASSPAANMSLSEDGEVSIGNNIGSLDVTQTGGTTMGKMGPVEIGNIVSKMMDLMPTSTTTTPLGTYPLDPSPTQNVVDVLIELLQN